MTQGWGQEVAVRGGVGVPSLCSVRSVEMGNEQLGPKGSTLGYAGRVPSLLSSLRSFLAALPQSLDPHTITGEQNV